MKKIYHLSTCGTCKRAISEIKPGKDVVFHDIKKEKISPDELDEMVARAGSHEALFSRLAMKYRSLGLDKKKLTEKDYRDFILQEYTFLRRPVMINGDRIFIGSSRPVIAAAKDAYAQ